MHKLLAFLFSGALLATSFTAITSPSASAETTLATCTDLVTQKTVILKANQESCKPLLAMALWHIQQSDSSERSGAGYANLRTCTSKRAQFDYRLIKSKCTRYQNTSEYGRTLTPLEIPIVSTASARGYDSAVFALAATTQNLDAPIAYYLITNIKTGQIDRVPPNNSGELSLSNLFPLTSYTFTIAAVSVDGISLPSTITPVITTGAVPVARVAAVVLNCTNGGTCNVGDRGPGGGIVFYVSATNFTSAGSACNTTCKYLEVAPATWQSAGVSVADDAYYVWSTNKTTLTGQDTTTVGTESNFPNEKFNWKIGQGFYNTSVMRESSATSSAQAAVLAYVGTSTAGQWFIPSMNELNELCKYARGQSTGVLTVACVTGTGTFKSTSNVGTDLGGFVVDAYWSSSERNPLFAWYQYFDFNYQDYSDKSGTAYVRPVRAF